MADEVEWTVRSDELRRDLRKLLDSVEHEAAHVIVQRYDRAMAVLVPVDWYSDVADLAAMAAQAVERGGFTAGDMEWLAESYRAKSSPLRRVLPVDRNDPNSKPEEGEQR